MIDLQLHTTDSDGTWPWIQVLEHCKKIGLKAYAITDHDTVVRKKEIEAWAQKNDEMAIPGLELSTRENDQTVHLLGYFLTGPLKNLEEKLQQLRQGRNDRNTKIIGKLQDLGIQVTDEELEQVAGNATVGRPHIARLLLQKQVVQSIAEAFEKYLAHGGSAYFPKDEIPLKEGIELLHEAGAVTSVAHPGLLKRSPEEMEESLNLWKSWGLDGIEAIYPAYKERQVVFFQRMAQKFGFIVTGGSDFHGENKPHIQIGIGAGQWQVPDVVLEPLLKKKEEIQCRFIQTN